MYHNWINESKGQENKINTIVKDRETFYRRHIVPITSYSEVKYVLEKFRNTSKSWKCWMCNFSGRDFAVVLLLLIRCFYTSHCLWWFCVGLCFVVHYFVFFLVLKSSWRGRESWLSVGVLVAGQQCVIVVFPGHIHLLSGLKRCDCGISWSYSLTLC